MKKPLADRVIIEPHEVEQMTSSNIVIPDSAQERPSTGIVVAVGKGKKDEQMEVKHGDIVTYGKYAGQEIIIDEKTYLIMRESEILCID